MHFDVSIEARHPRWSKCWTLSFSPLALSSHSSAYVSLLNIVSQEVVPQFYVFGSGVKHGIFGNINGTRAITHERYMGALLTKVTQRVCDPKQLWATTSGSNIFGFCGRLSNTRLFARRPRNKWGTQKLASTRSRFPIDLAPRKVGIRKTKKRKGRGRRVPKTKLKSVSKIAEDPLDDLPMWSPRQCLKMSAQTLWRPRFLITVINANDTISWSNGQP
jgi:hypothetical protein